MVEMVNLCVGWLLIAVGVVGCIVPMLPGPPIAYLALLVAKMMIGDGTFPSRSVLLIAAMATIIVTVLDHVVPVVGAKKFNCSRFGVVGCAIGTVIGLLFLPFGVVIGPFFGALIGESVSGKNLGRASLGAIGALFGFLFGVIVKLACCGYIAYCFYNAID